VLDGRTCGVVGAIVTGEEATEAATTKEPQVGAPTPASARGFLEAIGAAVVPATVAFYLLGFVVSVPHFLRAGLPISAISPQGFIAAGLLFAVVTALPVLAGFGAAGFPPGKLWLKALYVLMAIVAPINLLWLVVPWWRALLFVAFVELIILVWPEDLTFSLQRGKLTDTVLDICRVGVFVLGVPSMFSWLIYPATPTYYGGGRPEPLLSAQMGHSHGPPPPAHDAWALAPCRSLVAPQLEVCRTVYRVHESPEYLFIAIVEVPGLCPASPSPWTSWPLVQAERTGCFQRIANAEITRLETPGRP
jgi:hypothetical protein